MSDEYITTDDFINANRSPPLSPTHPRYETTETPPPLVDIDPSHESDTSDVEGEGVTTWAQRLAKGPNYPDIACKAAREYFIESPGPVWEDRKPRSASIDDQMVEESERRYVSGITYQPRGWTQGLSRASHKLNVAIQSERGAAYTPAYTHYSRNKDQVEIEIQDIHSLSEEEPHRIDKTHRRDSSTMSNNSAQQHPRPLNVRPPPRVSLPPIKTRDPLTSQDRDGSIATSPTLAKFTITPPEGHTHQQLPKLHTTSSQTSAGTPNSNKQTLPSLKTTLGYIADQSDAAYTAHSPALSRPSPGQHLHFGPSPSAYINSSGASAISPPRISSHPSYWRTVSREPSSSTPSDNTPAVASVGIPTPSSSSYLGHSPSSSVHTPGTIVHEYDARRADDAMSATSSTSQYGDTASQYGGSYAGGSFKCNWSGCNAPPFQTQYLLNSHANVHSNTRPHFCPVADCPRGPGGQGFKRKNEMIRHGLVHQSPGYVCPFCPDQQHKYPRPDNLQRHVRVHHVDRDRDDPLLREVLAQRPEGGNRGRRRRLGS